MPRSVASFGIGVREELQDGLLSTERAIDWLEVVPENWARCSAKQRSLLDALAERWPIVPHSVSLSMGGGDPLDARFLEATSSFCARYAPPFWSDHLCYSQLGGVHSNELLPLPYSNEAVDRVAARARVLADRLGAPLVLENITYYAEMPGGSLDEAAFVRAALEASGCELLLDVNNVYVNAVNFGRDPRAFIDAMPMDRVRMVHIAGHSARDGILVDTHEGPIPEPVWDLYRHAIRTAGRVVPTLLEWDTGVPALDQVVDELDRAREHARRALEAG